MQYKPGRYDRIVSVGMFEHVGSAHYVEFFTKVKELLDDDGVMLLHAIGRMEQPGGTNTWLRKYIFPGGYTRALSEVLTAIEKVGLWVTDMEILRLHYAETLRGGVPVHGPDGTLMRAGVRISMDGRGRWMDNVFIERLWRSLKYEDIYLRVTSTAARSRPASPPGSPSTTGNVHTWRSLIARRWRCGGRVPVLSAAEATLWTKDKRLHDVAVELGLAMTPPGSTAHRAMAQI